MPLQLTGEKHINYALSEIGLLPSQSSGPLLRCGIPRGSTRCIGWLSSWLRTGGTDTPDWPVPYGQHKAGSALHAVKATFLGVRPAFCGPVLLHAVDRERAVLVPRGWAAAHIAILYSLLGSTFTLSAPRLDSVACIASPWRGINAMTSLSCKPSRSGCARNTRSETMTTQPPALA